MLNLFIKEIKIAIDSDSFVQLLLSKPQLENGMIKGTYKPILINEQFKLQLISKFRTKELFSNFDLEDAITSIENMLSTDFLIATLFTTKNDFILEQNKKRKWKLYKKKPTISTLPELHHDQKKMYLVDRSRSYLKSLGIVNSSGRIAKDKGDKYRQIQKFVEIIDDIAGEEPKDNTINIVDMGCGKGYLTFALYDYLTTVKAYDVKVTGIELRPHLVDYCNALALEESYDNLSFELGDIASSTVSNMDMLIALHACDTATDDAIYKGIINDAKWIICSPCCQHQIRSEIENVSLFKDILKHGILMERMSEMLTDGIRAMILEAYGYKTKVFEFVSTHHTGKNLMIVAVKEHDFCQLTKDRKWNDINMIKDKMGVKNQHLQTLLDNI